MSKQKFDKISIKDLVTKLTDYVSNGSFKSLADNVKYQKSGYARLIRLKDYNNDFALKDSVWVNKSGYKFLKNSSLKGGEIIINNVGEYAGTVFLAPNLPYPTTLAPNSIMMTTKDNDLFYYYYFKSSIGYNQIRKIVSSSGQPKFNKTNFKKIIVPRPELQFQNKVANNLYTIDRKILNNKKINANLEALAKTIYDYWFLQFEFPNEERRPYKSSGGKMVYNEQLKREIPEGWEVHEIGFYIKENEKSSIQVNEVNNKGKIPFFTSGEEILNCSDGIVSGLNIYMSTGGNATIKIYNGEASYSTDTWCINCADRTLFIYEYLMNIKQQINDNYFAGSGLKHLKKDAFKKILICMVDNKIIHKFNNFVFPIFQIISKNKIENQELSSLRDFLLPLLINGQVTFKEENEKEKKQIPALSYIERFNYWKQMQGYAARGDVDEEILKQIFDVMDRNAKK